jgi:hypothetical protein
MSDKLEEAGNKAADALEALWNLDVFDPPIGSSHPRARFCLNIIETIIRNNNWDWALPYRGDGPPQWCGMTAGAVWFEAGLDQSWLATYFASTYRLKLWATYQRFDTRGKQNPPPTGRDRRLYVDLRSRFVVEPRRGDIVIVGDGNPETGDHVTVNMGYDPVTKTFDTISGNGGGLGPRGDARQGISRKKYRVGRTGYAPMYLIRPAVTDLL